MTIRELIQNLNRIEDQDTRVMIKGYEGGFNDLIMIDNTPAMYEMALGVNTEWYYGAHELIENMDRDYLEEFQIVKAIIL